MSVRRSWEFPKIVGLAALGPEREKKKEEKDQITRIIKESWSAANGAHNEDVELVEADIVAEAEGDEPRDVLREELERGGRPVRRADGTVERKHRVAIEFDELFPRR